MADDRITPDETALVTAAAHGDTATLRRQLAAGTSTCCGLFNGTQTLAPLHYATGSGNATAVQLLLEHGADPNAVSGELNTPLDLTRNDEVRRLLVSRGALTAWSLMTTRPVIGVSVNRVPTAPINQPVTVDFHRYRDYSITVDRTGARVGASGHCFYAFNTQGSVIWPQSFTNDMFMSFGVEVQRERWTVRTPEAAAGNRFRGRIVWIQGANGFRQSVFFPTLADKCAISASAPPDAGTGSSSDPAPIKPNSLIPIHVRTADGNTYTVDAEFRSGWFYLHFTPRRPYGDDKHALTEEQYRQLAAGRTVEVGPFTVTPLGPLR